MKNILKTLRQFKKLNPDFNWPYFNTWHKKAWNAFIGSTLHEKTPKHSQKTIQALQAYQRLYRLSQHHEQAEALIQAGYHSGIQIAGMPKHAFVKEAAPLFTANGTSAEAQAEAIHRAAVDKKSRAVLTYTNIMQQNEKHYKNARFANFSLDDNGIAKLPGYTDLFGDIDFCACESCRSIFSPAAYFVDLMRLQANYMTDVQAPYALETRRPDLWEIPLSCEDTNTEVSKLELVNTVLKKHVDESELPEAVYPWGLPFNYSLHQIRKSLAVNKTSLYNVWASLNASFTNTNSAYIELLNLSAKQWKLFSTPRSSETELTELLLQYGLSGTDAKLDELKPVTHFLQQTGLNRTQLDDLLTQGLSAAEMSGDNDAREQFYINSLLDGDTEGPMEVGPDPENKEVEIILHTTQLRFDHINRFVRLANALGFTYSELDWCLQTIASLLSLDDDTKKPAIDNITLSYLALIRQLMNRTGATVLEAAGMLGPLKDTGTKSGPSFFQQVFQNSNIPNKALLVGEQPWIVPKPGTTEDIAEETHQVQAALSAALRIGQDQLVKLGQAIVANKANELGDVILLNPKNLSVLYRLSLLPTLCGLSIDYLTNPDLFDELKTDFEKATTISGPDVGDGLRKLMAFSDWLRDTHFSANHLQYVLTGKSLAPDLQNQVMGKEVIANFNSALNTAVNPILLTKGRFENTLSDYDKVGIQSTETSTLYGHLTSEPTGSSTYIDSTHGVIQQLPTDHELEKMITASMHVAIRQSDFSGSVYEGVQTWADLTEGGFITLDESSTTQGYIAPTAYDTEALEHYLKGKSYTTDQMVAIETLLSQKITPFVEPVHHLLTHQEQSQKQVFTQQLAGQLGIAQPYIPLLLGFVPTTIVQSLEQANGANLKLLQRYAQLMEHLFISSTALQEISDHPMYFGVSATVGGRADTLLTYPNIQALETYKSLVVTFQDSQNYLINYFSYAHSKTNDALPSRKEAADQLADITQWNSLQIQLLMKHLWPETTATDYGTAKGVATMKAYFDKAQLTQLDIRGLLALESLSNDNESEKDYVQSGNALWAGLQTDDKLSDLTDHLNATERDALVPLVMHNLNSDHGLVLETPRDLYEYLLIDVEVQSIVTTSKVKAAVSAVQLYIYQGLNNLNPGAPTILNELIEWWPWMEHYRTWKANREVFLYPENYIEPQLRKNKTPQFAQLESDLQQANLAESESVIQAFNKYMDGFVEVNNLDIIGSASNDIKSDTTVTRELCFIGRTKRAPHNYYYLTARFQIAEDGITTLSNHSPVYWGHWQPISSHMSPIGDVSPIYAFNNWYIFWVEKQQTGSTTTGSGNDEKEVPEYTAYIRYSTLDFNKTWRATKTFTSTTYAPPKDVDNRYGALSLAMIHSVKQVAVVFITNSADKTASIYWFSPAHVSFTPYVSIPFSADFFPDQSSIQFKEEKNTEAFFFQNRLEFDQSQLYENKLPFVNISLWFNANALPVEGEMPLLSNEEESLVAITSDGKLQLRDANKTTSISDLIIGTNTWNHIYMGIGELSVTKKIQLTSSEKKAAFVYIDDVLHSFEPEYSHKDFLNPNKDYDIRVCKEANGVMESLGDLIYRNKIEYKDVSLQYQDPSVVRFNGYTYLAFENEKFGKNDFKFGRLDVDSPRKFIYLKTPNFHPSHRPTLGVRENNLYTVWEGGDDYVYIWKILKVDEDKKRKVYLQKGTLSSKTHIKNIGPIGFISVVFGAERSETALMAYEKDGRLQVGLFYNDIDDYERLTATYTLKGDIKIDSGVAPVFVYKDKDVHVIWRFNKQLYQAKVTYEFNSSLSDDKVSLTEVVELGLPTMAWAHSIAREDGNYDFAWVPENEDVLNFSPIDNHHTTTELYVNGVNHSIEDQTKPEFGKLRFGNDGEHFFNGEMQETLILKGLPTSQEIASLYHDAKDQLSHGFSSGRTKSEIFASDTVQMVSINSQPDWSIATDLGGKYLVYPFSDQANNYVKCIRFNSTAIQTLSELLLQQGVEGLLTIDAQNSQEVSFENLLPIESAIPVGDRPSDKISFTDGPMANYYWELFFHAPFLMANQLQTELQFKNAKAWYEYIFNPTVTAANADLDPDDHHENDRFWRFEGLRAFNNNVLEKELARTSVERLEYNLGKTTGSEQLSAYHNDPFDAHAIAALRPLAYQKTVVMHYINNLINWGDSLFSKYTIEDINEAEMLYVMAFDLLGKKPQNLPAPELPEARDLEHLLEDAHEELTNIEEFLIVIETSQSAADSVQLKDTPANYIPGAYFGIPENDYFNSYWDTVKERLYDIRNSLNINGEYQKTLLFEPNANALTLAGVLKKGTGVDLGSAQQSTRIPYYRFSTIIQRAKEVTGTAIQFGNALLSALEKKDSDTLNLLYNVNQQNILALTRASKRDALSQAEANAQALEAGALNAENRERYYTSLINKGLISKEKDQVNSQISSLTFQTTGQTIKDAAAAFFGIPTVFGLANGGFNPGGATVAVGQAMIDLGGILSTASGLAATQAGFQRRNEEWRYQQQMATQDVAQVNAQLVAARYYQSMAQQEIDILEKNIAQEQKVEEFLKNKFSNQALYAWMKGKLASLYFQIYQLGLDLALQAQNAWAYEKGITFGEEGSHQPFVQGNNWDSLYHGLLAGETLQLNLQRMETAYMKQDQRRLEITKTLALSNLTDTTGAHALTYLNKHGQCTFVLDESRFSDDYATHYCRQIKSLSVSIPAVLGPYENIHATMTQTSNTIYLKPDFEKPDEHREKRTDYRSHQQIAISKGLKDTGLFELNFNDPRYLPFEGTGAVSTWELSIPLETNNKLTEKKDGKLSLTLTEVILEIKYTALS